MTDPTSKYRFLLINAFSLAPGNDFQMRSFTGPKETQLYNFSPHTAYFQTMGHYDIPRFREGGLTSQAMAIFLDSAHLDRALHRTLEMIYWLRREAEENADFALVRTVSDLERVKAEGITSGFLTFEGFESLESDLKLLDVFSDLGRRMASMTHSRRNFFADGTQMGVRTAGLSKPGQQAVARMNELGGDIVPEAKQTPEGLRTWLKPEIDKWGALIRAAGTYAD